MNGLKMQTAAETEPTVFAVAAAGRVRVQMWINGFTASAEISQESAQKLIRHLQDAIATLPRVGTAADLGCEVL